jgi:hypothetical protein
VNDDLANLQVLQARIGGMIPFFKAVCFLCNITYKADPDQNGGTSQTLKDIQRLYRDQLQTQKQKLIEDLNKYEKSMPLLEVLQKELEEIIQENDTIRPKGVLQTNDLELFRKNWAAYMEAQTKFDHHIQKQERKEKEIIKFRKTFHSEDRFGTFIDPKNRGDMDKDIFAHSRVIEPRSKKSPYFTMIDTGKVLYISIRGTQNDFDKSQDMSAGITGQGFHSGFMQYAYYLAVKIEKQITRINATKDKWIKVVLCGHSLGAALALIIGCVIKTEIAAKFIIRGYEYEFPKLFNNIPHVECMLMNCPGIVYSSMLDSRLINNSQGLNWCHFYAIGDHVVDLNQYIFPFAPRRNDIQHVSEIPLTTDGGTTQATIEEIFLYRHMSYLIEDSGKRLFVSINEKVCNACSKRSNNNNLLTIVREAFPISVWSLPQRVTMSMGVNAVRKLLSFVPTRAVQIFPPAYNKSLERNYIKSSNPDDVFSILTDPYVIGGKAKANTRSFMVIYQRVYDLITKSNRFIGPKEDEMIKNEIRNLISKSPKLRK